MKLEYYFHRVQYWVMRNVFRVVYPRSDWINPETGIEYMSLKNERRYPIHMLRRSFRKDVKKYKKMRYRHGTK